MKILQVTREQHADRRYGLGRAVAQLATGLQGLGVACADFCAGDLHATTRQAAQQRAGAWAARQGVGLQPVFEVISLAWETGRQAARQAAAVGATHVHCHDAVVAHGYLHAMQAAGVAALPCGLTQHAFGGIAATLHAHVLPLSPPVHAALTALEATTMAGLDWAVFLTDRGAERVAADLGFAARAPHWRVIPHARPDWAPRARAAARQRLGWRPDERVLLAVGQLVPLKRMDWIVRALQPLAGRWRLVVLGEGDVQGLRAAAAGVGAPPPEVTAVDDPRDHYAAADAFTSASATESFGMAHLEALRMGLPVACTAVGGVPEVVGPAARLLPDDEQAYARGLRDFLADDAGRAELARHALDHAGRWPDLAAVARRHRDLYAAAQAPRQARPPLAEPFAAPPP